MLLSLLQCGNKKLLENENNESNNSDFKISSNITIANNAQNPNVVKIKESHKSRKSKRDNKSQRTLLLTRNVTQLVASFGTPSHQVPLEKDLRRKRISEVKYC